MGKTKWTLDPNGKKWANDEERYGFKLLTKMGWKNGKGLGKNEDGNTSHVKVSMKDNRKGIGFAGPDDDWIAHQDDFNSLLSTLNEDVQNKKTDSNDNSEFSTGNKKPQVSKFRILYKKFYKGKDMSNYSVADIDAIFGNKKKRIKAKKTTKEKLQQFLSSNSFGKNSLMQTFASEKSSKEYFADKLARLKKNKNSSSDDAVDDVEKLSVDSNDGQDGVSISQQHHDNSTRPELGSEKTKSGEPGAVLVEQNTEICSIVPLDTNLSDRNESSTEYVTFPNRHKKCKGIRKESRNILTETTKKGKNRKRSDRLEQESVLDDDNKITETDINCEKADENSLLGTECKKKKKESKSVEGNSMDSVNDKVCMRRRVLQELSMFSEVFPDRKTLLILEKYENLYKNVNNSAIGTSNIFTVSGYGNVKPT